MKRDSIVFENAATNDVRDAREKFAKFIEDHAAGTILTMSDNIFSFGPVDDPLVETFFTSMLRGRLMPDIKAFHEKFGIEYNGPPRVLPHELRNFREKFMHEELAEYAVASTLAEAANGDAAERTHHLANVLDALVDLVYVALGTAYLHGFDFDEAWRRVQEANMKKVRAQSAAESKRGYAGDVVKPPGWEAPDHKDLVETHTMGEP